LTDCPKSKHRSGHLCGKPIAPEPITGRLSVSELIDRCFTAYNAARVREICELYAKKIAQPDVVIGMSFAGALTPAGIGMSCLIPLIERGLVDWIVTTGANCYHDLHFALGLELHRGTPFVDDNKLFDDEVVRIYDIFMDFRTLLKTDNWLSRILATDEFNHTMSSSEMHYRLGAHAAEKQKELGIENKSFLATATEYETPVYTSSPGDSTIGLNLAALNVVKKTGNFDVLRDVNETSAIVLFAKTEVGKSAATIWGGGSPKNFLLQTEPQLQEILGFQIKGHDYFFQVTDARPDTGGLSGATPSEAVSWGKVDPDMVPETVVCYADTTIIMPLVVAYLVENDIRREPRRLYGMRDELLEVQARKFREREDIIRGTRSTSETVDFLRSHIKDKPNDEGEQP
jgi:deoxyhypusine synthase